MPRRLIALFALASALTVLFAFTAILSLEGSLDSKYLVLKPYPSLEHWVGGGEEGAWKRAHPNEPAPWWQSKSTPRLAYGGSWEDPVWWPTFYTAGYLLTPILWLTAAVWTAVWAARRIAAQKRLN
ncbi:MAG: hypothetical protein QM608_04705 [Caulobacter sp.]